MSVGVPYFSGRWKRSGHCGCCLPRGGVFVDVVLEGVLQ